MSRTFLLESEEECLYKALRTVLEANADLIALAAAAGHSAVPVYVGGGAPKEPTYPHIQAVLTDDQDLWHQAEIYAGQWCVFDLTVYDEGTDSTRVKAWLKRAQACVLGKSFTNDLGRVGQIMRVGRVPFPLVNLANEGFIARGNKFKSRVKATQTP